MRLLSICLRKEVYFTLKYMVVQIEDYYLSLSVSISHRGQLLLAKGERYEKDNNIAGNRSVDFYGTACEGSFGS